MPSPPRWLSTLIQLRRQNRDDCRRQLDEAVRAGAVLADKAMVVERQATELVEMRRRASDLGKCDLTLLLAAQRHQAALHLEQSTAQEQIELVSREVERRRSLVVAAEQELRTLENLAERKSAQARREADRREAKQLDDLAVIAHNRRSQS